ncbi:MAG: hypothetical protein GX575_07690 [Candidatus Anammoximicrobium sp.]|nr:hypothetical protein [Candidatus Anammoximicrobium sp.]
MDAFCFLAAVVVSVSGWGSEDSIPQVDIDTQNRVFQELWGERFVWKYDSLPSEGSAPEFRMPYAGYIYPDSIGGTYRSLRKYDQAFYPGRGPAEAFEWSDIAAHKQVVTRQVRQGNRRFGSRLVTVRSYGTPYWHGHCNGWAAAAIRHGEPQRSVTKNGVVFAPSDIKSLLAELYTYSEIVDLGGENYGNVHPGTLHAVLANWLGRHAHPIGMEAMPGREKWNYPIYGFSTSATKRSEGRHVEVRMELKYVLNISREQDQAPQNGRTKYFHYLLNLDAAGNIVGGYYYRDSSQIDLLWVARYPLAGGQEGNEQGNPHLKVSDVLALWRASVDKDTVAKWVNIEPVPKKRSSIAQTPIPADSVVRADPDAADAR